MRSYILSFCLIAVSSLYGTDKHSQSPAKSEKVAAFEWKQFNGNRINASIYSAGPYADYLRTNSSGLEWPKGSGKHAVYTAGMWIIGRHQPSGKLRTAVMDYQTEYQPGPVLGTYNTATNDSSAAANPYDKKYRIYKINKGENEENSIDYAEWPGDLGAPYVDVNKNGTWDKGIDKPKLIGDQTLWSVYNDLDKKAHGNAGLTMPLGIEVQATYFGYDNISYVRDIMFMKWRIINKSDADYEDVYFSLWSDTDLGDANDDITGCDTTLQLSFMYNGDNLDGTSNGYGSQPPADGFAFLQGPIVPGGVHDTALFEGKKIGGNRNLKATSYIAHLKSLSHPDVIDAPLRDTAFVRIAYNYQRGIGGYSGVPYINPQTGKEIKFLFPGDPVTESGWIVSTDFKGDHRSLLSSGPFNLAQGDTQEVIGAFVIAQGTDRLNSITELRKTTQAAHSMYRLGFPAAPDIAMNKTAGNDTVSTYHCSTPVIDLPIYNAKIYVYSPDTLGYLSKYFLFDDGKDADIVAGDKVFSTSFSVPVIAAPYHIDMTWYRSDGSYRFDKVSKLSTALLGISDPIIYSDNLNHDGKANAGETFRYAFSIKNHNQFTHSAVTAVATWNAAADTIHFVAVSPFGTTINTYIANDPSSYFSISLPLDYNKDHVTIPVTITDSLGNEWRDSVTFAVTKFQVNAPAIKQTSGKSNAKFDIVVVDQAKIKNKTYLIYGIDSTGYPQLNKFGVKDSLTGEILAANIPATTAVNSSPTLPEIDGFKILVHSVTTGMSISAEYQDTAATWFNPQATVDTIGTLSTVHYGDLPEIRFKFSPKLGYTDVNGNGKYDVLEPYVPDSLNTGRSQRAYFYRQESGLPSSMHFVEFKPVPFAVFDVSGGTERQLTVVVLDRDKNGQWDILSTLLNTLYVFNPTYDPTGVQFDSSKGGIDLSQQLRTHSNLPLYYKVDLTSVGFAQTSAPYSTYGELYVTNSHPFSSKDQFTFNPTILTGIHDQNYAPAVFNLEQNYPNPFNPNTTIRYSLPKQSKVILSIYNILGQRVAMLVNDVKSAGNYAIQWNGRNESGNPVASGIYFYHITADGFASTKKMLLLK